MYKCREYQHYTCYLRTPLHILRDMRHEKMYLPALSKKLKQARQDKLGHGEPGV